MLSSRQFAWIIQTNSMILAAVLSTRWWLMCIIPSIIHNSQHKASMASKWQSYFYYEGRHRRPFPPFSSLSIYSSSCKVYTPFNIISWLTCQVEILNNNKKKKKLPSIHSSFSSKRRALNCGNTTALWERAEDRVRNTWLTNR